MGTGIIEQYFGRGEYNFPSATSSDKTVTYDANGTATEIPAE